MSCPVIFVRYMVSRCVLLFAFPSHLFALFAFHANECEQKAKCRRMQFSFNSENTQSAPGNINKCGKIASFAERGRAPRHLRSFLLRRGRLPDDFLSPIRDASGGWPTETSRVADNAGPRTRHRPLGYPSPVCPVGEQVRLPVTSCDRAPIVSASSPPRSPCDSVSGAQWSPLRFIRSARPRFGTVPKHRSPR